MKKRTAKQNIKLKGGIRRLKSAPRNEIYLVLDNIRSMYNVGAMFRTADGVRAKKIYLCGITAQPPREKIFKTSLGAVEWVDWEYRKKAIQAVRELKEKGVRIVCLEQTDNSIHFKKAKYEAPVAVVVGHELRGITNDVLKLADLTVELPMHGRANSLNVATATGIILYEVLEKIPK
ncbi:MAG: RNA methyltransferase [Candidatus Berkelbacteria bacterium]|nr:RNA methyltransferase [Candidatus Berkelbacteria bacterium]